MNKSGRMWKSSKWKKPNKEKKNDQIKSFPIDFDFCHTAGAICQSTHTQRQAYWSITICHVFFKAQTIMKVIFFLADLFFLQKHFAWVYNQLRFYEIIFHLNEEFTIHVEHCSGFFAQLFSFELVKELIKIRTVMMKVHVKLCCFNV